MPLKKLLFKAGVNRENTRYTTEGGWFDCNNIRFRQGSPEKLGGWSIISNNTFKGVCRALWNWSTLFNESSLISAENLIGVGTNLKYYIELGAAYYDITPIRYTSVIPETSFTVTGGSYTVKVNDPGHGAITGDFVTYYNTITFDGVTITGEYQVTVIDSNNYTIQASTTGVVGWGAGPWGGGTWGIGTGTGASDTTTLTGITITDTTGDFACSSPANTLYVGQPITISGTFGGTGSISGYANPTTYYIIATNGSTTFQLSTTRGGTAVTTTAGTPTGLTYTLGLGVIAEYQINTGPAYVISNSGWGTGAWGFGSWGNGQATANSIQLWSQKNFGAGLVFGVRGGGMYYWNPNVPLTGFQVAISVGSPAIITLTYPLTVGTAIQFSTTGALPAGLQLGTIYYVINVSGNTCNVSTTVGGSGVNTYAAGSGVQSISTRGINLVNLANADVDTPVVNNVTFVSDIYRFVFAFGCNDYGTTVQNPMLIRWADQNSLTTWAPSITNQAGSSLLSRGSQIVTAIQTRQEVLVITDSATYSLQYVGAPYFWGTYLLTDNISIMGQNAAVLASGAVYWMGFDKFYVYSGGAVNTLNCDLRRYVFTNINQNQRTQVYASTNEAFNEVWWFYPSANALENDSYVVYNYLDNIWYYGQMSRTAWIDSGISTYPTAAIYDPVTQTGKLLNHEFGLDDNSTGTPQPMDAYITSSEFDIEDGEQFGFVWRILPDITFTGSTATNPQATMFLYPLASSGAGYTNPASVGGTNSGTLTETISYPVEQFTQYLYTRVRGRQLVFKIENAQLGTAWQLGAPRIDIRTDGRRGG